MKCEHPDGKMVFFDSTEDGVESGIICCVCELGARVVGEDERRLRVFSAEKLMEDGRALIRKILSERGDETEWPDYWEKTVLAAIKEAASDE